MLVDAPGAYATIRLLSVFASIERGSGYNKHKAFAVDLSASNQF